MNNSKINRTNQIINPSSLVKLRYIWNSIGKIVSGTSLEHDAKRTAGKFVVESFPVLLQVSPGEKEAVGVSSDTYEQSPNVLEWHRFPLVHLLQQPTQTIKKRTVGLKKKNASQAVKNLRLHL